VGLNRSVFLTFVLLTVPAFAGADVSGVPNFHEVNPQLYRGAQPSAQGFQSLAKLGIRTVLDLRESGGRSVAERREVEADGMLYISVPFNGLSAPTAEQIAKVLGVINDSGAGPVFIHCRRGADRTGTVVACYRVCHDHWENQKALSEAKSFGMSRLEKSMRNYVLHYQAPAQIQAITAVN
jgi:tyrosine-protein phosphatase SIW14